MTKKNKTCKRLADFYFQECLAKENAFVEQLKEEVGRLKEEIENLTIAFAKDFKAVYQAFDKLLKDEKKQHCEIVNSWRVKERLNNIEKNALKKEISCLERMITKNSTKRRNER